MGEYVNTSTPILFKHNKCNNEFNKRPNDFLRGERCPVCSSQNQITSNYQILQKLNKIHGDKYAFLENTSGVSSPIKIKCNICGNIFKMSPVVLFGCKNRNPANCPSCVNKATGERFLKTTEQFKNDILERKGRGFTLLSEYKNSFTNVKMLHVPCNYKYWVSPNNFLISSGCPICGNNHKKTQSEFENEVYQIYKNEYSVLSEYINTNTKIEIKHNTCGLVYSTTPHMLLDRHGCPKCALLKNSGENHYKWNGGVTEIYAYLRKVIEPWKFDSVKHYSRKCLITGKSANINIHHLIKPFKNIVEECFSETGIGKKQKIGDYSFEELKKIKELCLSKHYLNFGIPILNSFHTEFHSIYSNTNNTKEQFLEFALTKGVDLSSKIS